MAAVGDVRAVERLLRTLDETPRLMPSVRSRALTRTDGDVPRQRCRRRLRERPARRLPMPTW